MKATVYPHMPESVVKGNPYIKDFIAALESEGIEIANRPHKNPLFSLFFKRRDSDVYIFHWIENVPDYKYGYIQAITAYIYILSIKLCGKKIVWFLHNKMPHARKHGKLKGFLMKTLIKYSNLIITHAGDGKELIAKQYAFAINKTWFLDHPSKNRIVISPEYGKYAHTKKQFDILIWGKITPYKQIPEFLEFLKDQGSEMKVKVIGTCSSAELYIQLLQQQTNNIDIENKDISFEELYSYITDAAFVLIPYSSDTVLSSAILMDSLSYGAKVIGPDVGSFKDYAQSTLLKVYTFREFSEIPGIVSANKNDLIREKDYIRFLEENNWRNFIKRLLGLFMHK